MTFGSEAEDVTFVQKGMPVKTAKLERKLSPLKEIMTKLARSNVHYSTDQLVYHR